MAYIERAAQAKFIEMSNFFPVVLVTGARQVGKTTMLKALAEKERTYVTLDDLMVRELAKTDPALFFQMYKPPLIIDEVQYAPELFSYLKIICDNSAESGLFWLTGSQQYHLMKQVQESLAGRIGILELFSFSKKEIAQLPHAAPLDFTAATLYQRQKIAPATDLHDVFSFIWRGGMPKVQGASDAMCYEYFNSYIHSYLLRDATELGGISDVIKFRKFLVAAASLVSEQVNYKTLAEAADISQPTAKEWLLLLEGMGVVYLLKPYANNHLKRLTKMPKLYFNDTGLCAHLSMWLSQDTLLRGATSGHYFENFVVNELVKGYTCQSMQHELFYYRDSNAKEIDVIVALGAQLHPLEIKKSATPDRREIKKFSTLKTTDTTLGAGGIVCMCTQVLPIDDTNSFIPCGCI